MPRPTIEKRRYTPFHTEVTVRVLQIVTYVVVEKGMENKFGRQKGTCQDEAILQNIETGREPYSLPI